MVWAGGLACALAACSSPLASDPGIAGTSITYTSEWGRSVNQDLDMVFVVDQSAASADIQTKVGAQLPLMMTALQQCMPHGASLNVHTAVASSPDGQLFTALQGQLAGFLRPVAYLQIVFITAADDTSAGAVSDFAAQVRAVKADPDNQILVSAIVGPSAPRVLQFTNSFPNSVQASVDDASYVPVLRPVCEDSGVLIRPPCVPAQATGCVVTEQLTTVDGVQDDVIPDCAGVPAGAACWSFGDGYPGCFNGDRPILIANQPTGSDPARYSVVVTISCQLPAPSP